MTVLQAALLGALQGLTEFFPVSSSGHLVLLQSLFGFNQPGLLLDVWLHLASLAAILTFFGRNWWRLVQKYWREILPATMVTLGLGFVALPIIEPLFDQPRAVGLALLVTGVVNLVAQRLAKIRQAAWWRRWWPFDHLQVAKQWRTGWWLGVCQSGALIPGISRSGSTIAGSLAAGFSAIEAFQLSFLMAVPLILAVSAWQLLRAVAAGPLLIEAWVFGVAGGAAFITSLGSLIFLRKIVNEVRFKWFGVYCLVVGSAVLLFF